MTRAKGVDWAKRYQELREAEWQERQNLVVFAAEVRQRWMAKAERCGTLEGYARLLELASKLGHNACEVLPDSRPTQRTELTGPGGGPIRVEVVAALKKIYGNPLPGEVVEVHSAPGGQLVCEMQNGDGSRSMMLVKPVGEDACSTRGKQ